VTLRKQEVAEVTIGHIHDVAALAETVDV